VTPVIGAGNCRGFLLPRRDRWEAFTADEGSLGLFNTAQEAVDAILKHGDELMNERTTT
jgi:hypothetical protein